MAYLGRAGAAEEQRHFDAAAADYARARIALRQANDTLALVRVAANEGFLDLDQGRPAQALPQFIAATEGFKQWGALNEAIYTYIGQIGCYLALLDGRSAMRAADAAETLAQRIDNPSTVESLTLARAGALAAVGRLRESRDSLDRLRSTGTEPGDRRRGRRGARAGSNSTTTMRRSRQRLRRTHGIGARCAELFGMRTRDA
jgi:hypothetical protein